MLLAFEGELTYWKGPSPHHFVPVPVEESAELKAASALVTYGWGMVPVVARIGDTEWSTSLFPKDGGYLVPVKDVVRLAEGLEVGEPVIVQLAVAV